MIRQNQTASINVIVANQGSYSENFNLTVYANTTVIDTLTNLILTSGNCSAVTFTWNTSGFARAHTISAYAAPVSGEIDSADNNFTDGIVKVSCIRDINRDYVTNITDFQIVESHISIKYSL